MAATKKSIHNEGFEASALAFTYTVATERLDLDLAFLSEELNAQVAIWRDQWQASLPLADELPTSPPVEVPAPPSSEALVILHPPLEVHRE